MGREIKILHVNTFDKGGAANSCIRLHKGLLAQGVSSSVLFKSKYQEIASSFRFTPTLISSKIVWYWYRFLFALGLREHHTKSSFVLKQEKTLQMLFKNTDYFSFPRTDVDIMESPYYQQADIINLHWVADFLDYGTFFKYNKKPVVWTLHDLAPFTGGIHFEKIVSGVDNNGQPILSGFSKQEIEILNRNLDVKKAALATCKNIFIVAPSKWLMNKSLTTELFQRFPHFTIPYGSDYTVFKYADKLVARKHFNLPNDKTIILFVAHAVANKRKGFDFLVKAFEKLEKSNLLLCAIGAVNNEELSEDIICLGKINDENIMSLAYAAADAFIIPSLEDNLPNTMLEALLCGTPVIGFPVGGIEETIESGVNGLLCKEISVTSLVETINEFILTMKSYDRVKNSKEATKKYSLANQASEYIKLYNTILTQQ